MNDTPRTEAVWQDKNQNILEHARTLERELTAVTAERDALDNNLTTLNSQYDSLVVERDRLKALNLGLVTDLHREMDRHDFQAACARVNATLENTPI